MRCQNGPGFSEHPRDLDANATDFGRLEVRRPRIVMRATSVDDVVRALEFANARALVVVARGRGHSTRGQASIAGGLVVDLSELQGVEFTKDHVEVGAGIRWCTLLGATLARGLTPPILTDYLGLSVGGTLSVGGVGGQSFRHGLQTDQVAALTVVTGLGEVITCSLDEHRLLFDAVRAGMGQCGIIVRARMRLVAAPNAVLVNRLSYRDPARWLEDQALLASEGRFDYLLGSIVPDASGWRYWLEAARYIFGSEPVAVELADLHFDRTEKVGRQVWSFRDYANRLDAIEREMKAERTWQARHPWMDLFVPASAIERVVAKTLAELSPKQLQDSHTLTYPLRPETCTTPLTTVPKTEPSFLFGVGPNLGLDDVEGLERLERGYGRVLELATALGSGVYPIGYPLGSVVTSLPVAAPGLLSDAKRRYDPNHRMRVVQ